MPRPKPNRKAQRAKADRLFSRIIRARGICEHRTCGSTRNLQTAHIIPRRYLSVRWEYDNAFCLCSSCHVYFTYYPLQFEVFCIEKMGEAFVAMKQRAMAASGRPDYDSILERLERDADRLEVS